MSEFKIGDRVRYIGELPDLKSKVGTVVNVINYNTDSDLGVVFDEYIPSGHSLGGLCSNGHGLWCSHVNLELISEHRFNVIITSAGDTTTAKLLHGKKVEKEVSVKRYYRDDYSEEAAVEAVCKKLFGKDKPKEDAEPEGINCKAVYVADDDGFGFLTRGKIYEFSDGKCVDDDGDFFPIYVGYKIKNYSDELFAKNFVKLVGDDE